MKVTINGYDPYSFITIKYINIWDDPNKREMYVENEKVKSNVLGQVKHKKKVILLDRKKDDCLIKYKNIVGYIKYWWILEFKDELIKSLKNK